MVSKMWFSRLMCVAFLGMAALCGVAKADMVDNSSPDFRIIPAFGAPTQTNNGPTTTQTEVVAGQSQMPMLVENSAELLRAAEARYADIVSNGGFPKVPKGTYKKGSKGKGIVALNKRLFLEGYLRFEGTQGEFADIFTSATEDSVIRFQRNTGLAVTGKVDSNTLFALNVSADERLAAIRANIPRLEVYEKNLGNRYLVVNIPSQQIETVSNGRVYSRHNAIVGRPERPSPVVMTPLETVKFNPYWNAPVSIVERDIIPKLRSGTQILNDMNFKVFKGVGGPEIDPATVDWGSAVPDDYAFRQEPGPENAMATAKIDFLSTFGIYLHDTSEPQLFKTNNRFYSSGCIRVEKMPLLVQWVLNGQDGFGEAKIATMAETLERLDVLIMDPPELRVAYLTAWPAAKGTVAFRHDVYELDGTGFTVGQPMPVGEMSPDGQRYVLKPLPRQTPVDVAEAEGFGLFSFGSKKAKTVSAQKSLYGKTLFASTGGQDNNFATNEQPAPTIKSKAKKKFGLFDWESYRKRQAAVDTQSAKQQKPKKLIKANKTSKKIKPETIAIGNIPPEPTLDTPPKKPVVKTNLPAKKVKPEACKADATGKLPSGCKPIVDAAAAIKPKA